MESNDHELTLQEADRRYTELKRQHEMGALGDAEFDAQLRDMMARDDQGRWWAKSRRSGQWMYHNGVEWVPGTPPDYRPDPQNNDGMRTDHPSRPGMQTSGGLAALWIGLGILCSLIALLFVPLLFGGLAILFGYLAKRAGSGTGGIVTMVIGGVCVYSSVLLLVFWSVSRPRKTY